LSARAFVIVDPASKTRVAYVTMNSCMAFHIVKLGVVDALAKHFSARRYTFDNIMLSGEHTHSTPGGIGGTFMVNLPSSGFNKPNYDAAVAGVVSAILKADASVQPASVRVASGDVDDTNIKYVCQRRVTPFRVVLLRIATPRDAISCCA
jgi:neutral ceramidase